MEHLFLVFKVTAWRSPFRIAGRLVGWGGAGGGRAYFVPGMLSEGGKLWTCIDMFDRAERHKSSDETTLKMQCKTSGIYPGRRQVF